ncbi:MAG: hypothetical protein BRD50_06255 [Bacteroidetes bacterium SW_11_45_7]|nr:MAG: hypothetical protein BRD50_06255 [Bacteroidetes bacterium SW_11_45_7]
MRSFPVNNFLQNKQKIAALVRMLIINAACHLTPPSITAEAAKKCKKKARYSRSHSGQKSGAGGIRYYQ